MSTETPGTWILKPGQEGYDAACRAAMMACGIDPDSFGTYDQRLEAQRALRQAYDAEHGKNAHRSAQALNDMGTEDYLRALLAERAPWFEGRIQGIQWRMEVRFESRLAELLETRDRGPAAH